MKKDLNKISIDNFNYFRFKKIEENKYLLTNDIGNYLYISATAFKALRENPASLANTTYSKLKEKGFILTKENDQELIKNYRQKNSFLLEGPSLHIIVVSLRCDHKCVYCHASRKGMNSKQYDLDNHTGEKIVDFILNTTAESLCIEFQGGEPLVNFDIIKHIVNYTKEKKTNKNIEFSVVTNLNSMDNEKYNYLVENNIGICTSLDGPEKLHNKYRKLHTDNSFKKTIRWVKKITKRNSVLEKEGKEFKRVNALLTATKDSKDRFNLHDGSLDG